jgi:hypothetical protein
MSRMIPLSFVAILIAGCVTGEDPHKASLEKNRLACAEVGLDPDSLAFSQCVGDLAPPEPLPWEG